MTGWRMPMGRGRFAVMAAVSLTAPALTGVMGPRMTWLLYWIPKDLVLPAGFAMMALMVSVYVLSLAVLIISTARRLKDVGVTRWLAPLSLLAGLFVNALCTVGWPVNPVAGVLTVVSLAWFAGLALTPGRNDRLRAQTQAAQFG